MVGDSNPMTRLAQKEAIEEGLKGFSSLSLEQASLKLFDVLGYRSEKRLVLRSNNAATFLENFVHQKPFNKEQALLDDWETVDFLFQLTDAEIQSGGQGSLEFSSKGKFEGANIESYLFFAIKLKKPRYTRTQLAVITRAVNRLFSMPVMLLFRHGDTITFSIIRRRIHKRDESKDVLERVTLIKDIRFAEPLRAHIEILNDLSLPVLYDEFYFHNFVGLHQAWEKRLDTYALNERFYREIADWYFWATQHPDLVYPRDVKTEDGRSIFIIRLLTRLIFCWFLQEKGLIPHGLFRRRVAERMLHDFSPKAGTYYMAFLQNLFFATLNQESEKRGFRKKYEGTRDGNRGATNLYRYTNLLKQPEALLEMFKSVPFVNGGLFDCLDEVYQNKEGTPDIRLDDFSEEKKNLLRIPNELFFGEERELDLSEVYGDKRRRKEKVAGLIEILNRYKFTVEENTPLEQEIALDPELLGKVFENLLASYNEDTRTTARKATGSFYTPREIVTFMVDETLIAYLNRALDSFVGTGKNSEARLRQAFSAASDHFQNPFSPGETESLIHGIDRVKILDPACGSGAFPMGALHRLVDLLRKLDPQNEQWREIQRQKAIKETEEAYKIGDQEERQNRLIEIDEVFEQNASDYGRKLYLIENCIYGVDIQPIACQIAKLRFFIALIVDQNVNPKASNFGVRPLPNLETKIVAANILIPPERAEWHQQQLFQYRVREVREELERVRHDYFNARTPDRKRKCRERDTALRQKLAVLLQEGGMPHEAAGMLAAWDPYDQNAHAEFFDLEWMFGLSRIKVRPSQGTEGIPNGMDSGFDIVLGNPPYIRIQTLKQKDPKQAIFLKEHYKSAEKGNYDVYVVFIERSLELLRRGGNLAFIVSHKFFNSQYGEPIRRLISKGRYLSQVVHFGDQQVFPGSTNYVCLLFLSKTGAESVRFVKVEDLSDWFQTTKGIEERIPAQQVTGAEWNFVVGKGASLFDKLNRMPIKLGDVADIFVGLQTSADDVFIMDLLEEKRGDFKLASKSLNKIVTLEKDLLFPLVSGTDVGSYQSLPKRQYILFPYTIKDEVASLISINEIKRRWPQIGEYLRLNKKRLEEREEGRFKGDDWHRFGRSQNLGIQGRKKICVPRLAESLHAAYDREGTHFLDNVDVGGITWNLKNKKNSLEYLLALLNSSVLRWYFPHVSAPFRGGWRSANRQFLSQLPIPSAAQSQQTVISNLVNYLLSIHSQLQVVGDQTTPARDMLMVGYFEQVINGLVYELFFPEELHAARLHPFKLLEEAKLPKIEDISGSCRLPALRKAFEQIYDVNHPIRGCLFSLRSLEPVGIIEEQ
jgi:adenine-specific DNA-methyltransferase